MFSNNLIGTTGVTVKSSVTRSSININYRHVFKSNPVIATLATYITVSANTNQHNPARRNLNTHS